MTSVVGIGAGGHAKVLVDALRLGSEYDVVGLTDADPTRWGRTVLDVPVIGGDDVLPRLKAQGVRAFFVGVGSVGDCRVRRALYVQLLALGFEPIRVIHPRAIIAASAGIGPGAMILAGAVLNAAATVGANAIINTTAVVEHDCAVGDHAHVATGAKLASGVRVGEGAHIGIGAAVRQCTSIGAAAVVGAGAVVLTDVPPGVVVAGVPARAIRAAAGVEQS
jgi:sugar O-acyltransferase (sialic acid O-acetyltransferase NeuD family)